MLRASDPPPYLDYLSCLFYSGIGHVIRRSDPLLALAVFLSFRLRTNSSVTGVQPTLYPLSSHPCGCCFCCSVALVETVNQSGMRMEKK